MSVKAKIGLVELCFLSEFHLFERIGNHFSRCHGNGLVYLLPQRASLKRASKAADLIFMYMYYIYADEISIVSAYFGLPQCTASGPAGYSCLINRHKANKQCDHLSSLVFFYGKP